MSVRVLWGDANNASTSPILRGAGEIQAASSDHRMGRFVLAWRILFGRRKGINRLLFEQNDFIRPALQQRSRNVQPLLRSFLPVPSQIDPVYKKDAFSPSLSAGPGVCHLIHL